MSTEDDQAWLDALAGRRGPDAGPDAQEAAALRTLIQAQTSRAGSSEPPVALVDAAREAALVDRARREGLLAAAPAAKPWWRSLFAAPGRLAFASLAVALVAVAALRYFSPPLETLRSAENGVVRLESKDPQLTAGNITRELSAAGVHVSGYQRLGRIGIDADLPQPLSPEVRRVLDRHRIPIPKDGALTVEITTPR